MNKKLFFSILVVAILIVGASIVGATEKNYFSFSTPSTEKEIAIKEMIDKRVSDFKDAVDQDIKDSFDVKLEDFKKIHQKTIMTDEKYKDLKSIFLDILFKQNQGDVIPSVYVNETEGSGYILEKSVDGTNTIYIIEYSNGWKLSETLSRTGTYIDPKDFFK